MNQDEEAKDEDNNSTYSTKNKEQETNNIQINEDSENHNISTGSNTGSSNLQEENNETSNPAPVTPSRTTFNGEDLAQDEEDLKK